MPETALEAVLWPQVPSLAETTLSIIHWLITDLDNRPFGEGNEYQHNAKAANFQGDLQELIIIR